MLDFFHQCAVQNMFSPHPGTTSAISHDGELSPKPSHSSDGVKLVLMYHPHRLVVKEIVFCHPNLLQTEPDTYELFCGIPAGGIQVGQDPQDPIS